MPSAISLFSSLSVCWIFSFFNCSFFCWYRFSILSRPVLLRHSSSSCLASLTSFFLSLIWRERTLAGGSYMIWFMFHYQNFDYWWDSNPRPVFLSTPTIYQPTRTFYTTHYYRYSKIPWWTDFPCSFQTSWAQRADGCREWPLPDSPGCTTGFCLVTIPWLKYKNVGYQISNNNLTCYDRILRQLIYLFS